MKQKIQSLINKLGYKVTKYPDEIQQRKIKLLELNKINLVLDIGANGGHYASEIRRMGYKEKIVSFEPLSSAFGMLKNVSISDPDWRISNVALGDEDEFSSINISNNSFSSSILDMGSDQTLAGSDVYFIGKETITIKKLDSIFEDYVDPKADNVFLKIDAQGYEEKILAGACESLKHIKGIQIEMPLVEIYKGQMLLMPLLQKLYDLGFELQGLEQGFHNPVTMQLYELDGVFFKK